MLSVIDTRDEWFYAVHPERMVPSLKDQDPATGEKVTVFESTACLQYLAARFDTEGLWSGKTAYEKGAVLSWTAYQTAALGWATPIPTPLHSYLHIPIVRLFSDFQMQSNRKILALFSQGLPESPKSRPTAADHRKVSKFRSFTHVLLLLFLNLTIAHDR